MSSGLACSYPIALDIDEGEVRAAQLCTTRKTLAVRALARAGYGGEDTDGLANALEEVSRATGFKSRRASVHLPSGKVFSFPLRVRLAGNEAVEAAILREAGKVLPFPLDEAVLDYPSIQSPSGGDGTHRILLVAIRRGDLVFHLNALGRAGFVPEVVDTRVSALLRLHHFMHPPSPQPVVLCATGPRQTLLAVATGDGIMAHRTVNWGTDGMEQRLAANLDIADAKGNVAFLLKTYGATHDNGSRDPAAPSDQVGRLVGQLIQPDLDKLVYELHSLTGFARSDMQNMTFERLYIYGRALMIKALDRYVGSCVDMPVSLVNPFTKLAAPALAVSADGAGADPYDLALGLALRRIPWL